MTISLIGLFAVFALLFLGVPIAFGMGIVGFIGYLILDGFLPASTVLVQRTVEVAMNETLSVLPLFVLMGNFINHAGLSEKLFKASNAFLGHRRGGQSLATILACGGFSAVCGSSLATAATMAKIAMPQMRRYGYADSLAAGSIAAGGTLGILIPPSTILIIYGSLTETDIGKLFAAGIIPGIIGVAFYMAAVFTIVHFRPQSGPPGSRVVWRERWRALAGIWGTLALMLLVMGGIYLGIFTPTEAGGIGATGAFAFYLARGGVSWAGLRQVLIETGRTTAQLLFLLIGALMFAAFVNISGLPKIMVEGIENLAVAPVIIIFLMMLVFLALGCVLESLSMMLLLVPMFYPIVHGLGYDLIWFGIVVVVAIEISQITPPIGINVFVLKSVLKDVRTGDIFRGVTPFVFAAIARLILIILVPSVVLWLPQFMS